jgi:hypothetical protein
MKAVRFRNTGFFNHGGSILVAKSAASLVTLAYDELTTSKE